MWSSWPLEFDPVAYRGRYADLATMSDETLRRHWRDHGRAEGADRALLLDKRPRVEAAPLPSRPHPRADLHMDVTVRIARPRGAMRDPDHLHMLDRHGLLLPARADRNRI